MTTPTADPTAANVWRERPHTVVLCGSTRFKPEFEQANRIYTLAGMVVLAPGVFGHADGIQPSEDQKTALDALHFRKIDMADEVIVISPGDYIGDSTRREIDYAERLGKPIAYLRESVVKVKSSTDEESTTPGRDLAADSGPTPRAQSGLDEHSAGFRVLSVGNVIHLLHVSCGVRVTPDEVPAHDTPSVAALEEAMLAHLVEHHGVVRPAGLIPNPALFDGIPAAMDHLAALWLPKLRASVEHCRRSRAVYTADFIEGMEHALSIAQGGPGPAGLDLSPAVERITTPAAAIAPGVDLCGDTWLPAEVIAGWRHAGGYEGEVDPSSQPLPPRYSSTIPVPEGADGVTVSGIAYRSTDGLLPAVVWRAHPDCPTCGRPRGEACVFVGQFRQGHERVAPCPARRLAEPKPEADRA